MKKKIAILGSTGSIGKSILNIVSRDIKNFNVLFLTADSNYKKLFQQAKYFKVKNLIITNKESFKKAIKKKEAKRINIYNSFKDLEKILNNKKLDYLMSSISGIEGLKPTLSTIHLTKRIAIANKEAIICGWNLITKSLKKNNVEFVPVDSEHFSIWYGIKNISSSKISKIYLTASGGPFLNKKINRLKNVKISSALNHPNWQMGKKISIDSATMMNKVLEIIEARNIFNIPLNKLSILIHPKSYIHAIIKFNDGLIKIIAHDTTMEIPIFNSLYKNEIKFYKSKNLNFKILNNLMLKEIDKKRFPVVRLIDKMDFKNSLFETIIISANDTLVNLFLQKKITFNEISKILLNFLSIKEFQKYKKIKPKNIKEILKLNEYVRLKISSNVYKYL